jgi:hypothetical protein
MVYTLRFFSSKRSLCHNSNLFGSCVIHISYTEYAKIKKKNNSGAKRLIFQTFKKILQGVPLATETGISLLSLPVMRILQRNLKQTTDTFLFISHTTNVLLFKFRCNISSGVRMINPLTPNDTYRSLSLR